MATDEALTTSSTAHPPLQPGDRLTAGEFRRRYESMKDCKKAELIDGVVYMPSPVRITSHAEPHLNLITWMGVYCAATPPTRGADNATDQLDLDNEPQPDAMLFIRPEFGGRIHINEEDYVVGPPEFVAEVASSTVAYDRGPKLCTYLRHGVQEYLIWRVEDDLFEWYTLRDGDYYLIEPSQDGLLRSRVFPGLWLNTEAMSAGDLAQVLESVQLGIASPEHAQFVARMTERSGG